MMGGQLKVHDVGYPSTILSCAHICYTVIRLNSRLSRREKWRYNRFGGSYDGLYDVIHAKF